MTGTPESTQESLTWRKSSPRKMRQVKLKRRSLTMFMDEQNHGKAVATGFQGDSTEQEVEQLLRGTIVEIGMSTENVKNKMSCQTYHICLHVLQ